MKRLSYAIAFTLALAISGPAVRAMEANATHLHSSTALPRKARVPFATYRLRVHVENTSLTQLSINLPETLTIKRGLNVVDQTGQAINATLTVKNNSAIIDFTQPVAPGTILRVDLNGISTSDYLGRTWLLPVSSRSVGMKSDIPLGTARIQTSK